MATDRDGAKAAAATSAARTEVADGMVVGLGSGSTALLFVAALAGRIAEGLSIRGGIPTSGATEAAARRHGIPLLTFEALSRERPDEPVLIDVTVDGADEIDGAFRLVKGGGACLLREKIVASASRRMVVVADAAKRVKALGAFPLPVEVVPFGAPATRAAMAERLAGLLGRPVPVTPRLADGAPLLTDNGNLLFDCATGRLDDPAAVAAALATLPGVVEHGLFLEEADAVVLADAGGRVEVAERAR